MTRKAVFGLISLVTLVGASTAVQAQQYDAAGCRQANESCIVTTGKWDGDEFVSTFTNNCGFRVYLRYCNEIKRGRIYNGCEQGPLDERKTVTLRSRGGPTGNVMFNVIGSRDTTSDTACGKRVRK